jgi:urease accessory protein UreH
MAWSAPGIFGGDRLVQRVHVERGARVRLTSQSALQAHPSPGGEPAHLVSTYVVEDDARLTCEWDPLIPFANARFDQRIDVRLAERASLVWSDAFMSGRVARPLPAAETPSERGIEPREQWAFAELSHELKISRGALLEYVERYRLTPNARAPQRPWVAGPASYFGTMVCSGPGLTPGAAGALQAGLSQLDGIRAAADRLDAGIVLVRLMAESGVPFREVRQRVARAAEGIL